MEGSGLTKQLESGSSAASQGEKHQLKVSVFLTITCTHFTASLTPFSPTVRPCFSLSNQAKQGLITHLSVLKLSRIRALLCSSNQ